jgi:hypothetical protein
MSIDASFVGPISSRAYISFAVSAYERRPRFKFEQVSTFSIPMIRAMQPACSLPQPMGGLQPRRRFDGHNLTITSYSDMPKDLLAAMH